MEPQRRLVAPALDQQHQGHDNVTDHENGEIGRRVVGAVGLERQFARRAMATHLEKAAEQAAFAAARLEVEKVVLADASDGRALSLLAMIDAGLGRQEQAVQEAEHARELETFENSGASAPIVRCNLAVVYAWNGQVDFAISELDQLVNRPAGTNLPAQPTYGDFRRNPLWDPLRNDPRFTMIMKRLAPTAAH